jgi:hypothetical protein
MHQSLDPLTRRTDDAMALLPLLLGVTLVVAVVVGGPAARPATVRAGWG